MFDLNDNFITEFESIIVCAKEIGVHPETIRRNLSGEFKNRKYKFKYKEYAPQKRKP